MLLSCAGDVPFHEATAVIQPDPALYELQIALVVGDDALRSAIRMLLTVSGALVTEYGTAKGYLESAQTPGRCLVIDCQLPDMPRRWLRDQIAHLGRHTPIVVVTAYPEEFEPVRTTHENICVIHKPFDGSHFIQSVADTIRTSAGDYGAQADQQDLHTPTS